MKAQHSENEDHGIRSHWGFPGGSEVKASASNAGDPGSIPGLGRYPGEGNGNPLQYSCLENPGPITSWEIDGETVETVSDFIFLGSKITADGDCSHEIKRRYSLEDKL